MAPTDIDRVQIQLGDCTSLLKGIRRESIHMVLSDIPYGIDHEGWDVIHANTNSALGGRSPQQSQLGSGFARRGKPINGWSKADTQRSTEYEAWCNQWLPEVREVLLPGASAMLFGGRRTIHRLVVAAEDAGLMLRDILVWRKNRGHFKAQSLSKLYERRGDSANALKHEGWRLGNLSPVYEPVCWLQKPYRLGGTIADNMIQHGVGAINVSGGIMENVIEGDFATGESGLHPAQKPVSVLESLVGLVTQVGQTVLDPFMGSGSTGVAATKIKRKFIGFERDRDFFAIASNRLGKPSGAEGPKDSSGDALLF